MEINTRKLIKECIKANRIMYNWFVKKYRKMKKITSNNSIIKLEKPFKNKKEKFNLKLKKSFQMGHSITYSLKLFNYFIPSLIPLKNGFNALNSLS